MHAFLVSLPPGVLPGPDLLEIIPENSVGITEIRQINNFLSRKPIRSDRNVVIIHSAHLLTLPAQHAFLKILEEPPGNSQIYLVTVFPDQLLPTILSRVQISGETVSRQPDPQALDKSRKILESLLSASGVGERLRILDQASFTRESALEFLDHLEFIIHRQIQNSQPSSIHYQLVVGTRQYLKANVSVRLTMDHFALHLV